MPISPFRLERHEGWYDGSESLTSSECEPLTLTSLLALADDDALQRWEALSLGYPELSPGSAYLREAIAAHYTCDAGHVNVCAPQEGIFLAMHAMLSPGDHVIATVPCYESLTQVARSLGCTVSGWRPTGLDEVGGKPRFDPQHLQQLLQPSTTAVIANFPHNPTGALPTLREWDEMLNICDTHGCRLFVDEMYRGCEHQDVPQLSAAVDAYERGISLSGLSKAFGLPGLRVGWLASQDTKLMDRVQELKDYTTICPAAPSEALALIALTSGHAPLLARARQLVGAGLAALKACARECPQQLQLYEPSAGTTAVVKLLGIDNAVKYEKELRKRCNLTVAPLSLFGDAGAAAGDDLSAHVRVTYGRAATARLLARWQADLQANHY